jgi:hypothetical protein
MVTSVRGRIWGSFPGDPGPRTVEELGQFNILISTFGEDESGELYVVHGSGELYRLRFAPAALTGLRVVRPGGP